MLTITLEADMEDRVKREAARQGVAADALVTSIIDQGLPSRVLSGDGRTTAKLVEQWRREDATDDPIELARRQRETDDLLLALDRHRTETD
jgi:DNA-binding PucR family transcriptional regulator